MLGCPSLRSNPYSRYGNGFTLVELIISIVLLGLLAAVGSSMIVDTFTTTRMVDADNASTGQARYALERLAREIREVKYDSTNSIYLMTPDSVKPYQKITFTKTVGGQEITVTIDGATTPNLALGYSDGATATLSNQVSNFVLAYFDVSGTQITLPNSNFRSLIRFVTITLEVTDTTNSGQSISQRTRVALRNA